MTGRTVQLTRKAGAQTVQIRAANALIRPQPTPAQNGGFRAANLSSDRHAVRLAFLSGAILIDVLGSGGQGGRARSRSGLRLW